MDFAVDYNNEQKAIIVFSEKHISSEAVKELFNLALITGKLGKTASGLISLKEKNNSQGLFDMGIESEYYVGRKKFDNEVYLTQVKKIWGVNELPSEANDVYDLLNSSKIKNLFIFGEDPAGCAENKEEMKELLTKSGFRIVQDYFITETAELADLILPASYPFENGGSYSNTQKFVVTFDNEKESKLEKRTFSQLIELMGRFGVKNKFDLSHNITLEIATLLKDGAFSGNGKGYKLIRTTGDNPNRMFNHGCDYLTKRFDDYFEKQFAEFKELIYN